MNLLVPCAGRSSRYPTAIPKYLLSMYDNRLVYEFSIQPFLKMFDRVCFAVLREHEEVLDVRKVMKSITPQAEFLVLDQVTRGQAETVKLMLQYFGIDGGFLIKDSDSCFVPTEPYRAERNYVSVCNLRDAPGVNAPNKSFVHVNDQGHIVGIVEKRVLSDIFSCGGYFFASPEEYLGAFQGLDSHPSMGEFYVSHIIDAMIQEGILFYPMPCVDYVDLGTHDDWVRYRRRFGTYVFDLDGTILQNGTQYFSPLWGEGDVLPGAREKVNALYDAGQYVLIVTSRPERFREVTVRQLDRLGVHYHQLVMGVHHGQRVVVNDYASSSPYPAVVAINTRRDTGDYLDKL